MNLYESVKTNLKEGEVLGDWYGIPDVKFIWNGSWSDPEIEYGGLIYNTYMIDMEGMYNEQLREDLGREPTQEEFEKYMKDNGEDIKFQLANEGYTPERVANWVRDDIYYANSYDALLKAIEGLRDKTIIPEKIINKLKEQAEQFVGREDGEEDAIDQVLAVLDEEINNYENYMIESEKAPTVRVARNIKWVTDGDKDALKSLPKEVELPDYLSSDEVADYLSDEYGYLVNGLNIVDVKAGDPKYKHTTIKESDEEFGSGIADEAYDVADYIDKRCGADLQELPNGDRVLRRDDFDELFIHACEEVFGITDEDKDSFWSGDALKNRFKDNKYSGAEDVYELENTVRGILSYKGYETVFENEDGGAEEGDLVIRNWDELNESEKKSPRKKKKLKEADDSIRVGKVYDSTHFNKPTKCKVLEIGKDNAGNGYVKGEFTNSGEIRYLIYPRVESGKLGYNVSFDDEHFQNYQNMAKNKLKEAAKPKKKKNSWNKVTSDDIFRGIYYEIPTSEGPYYLYATWDQNFDFDEEKASGNIPEDAKNEEDWGGIYFDILDKTGDTVDGGVMITDEYDFDAKQLFSDLTGMLGHFGAEEDVDWDNAKLLSEDPDFEDGSSEDVEDKGTPMEDLRTTPVTYEGLGDGDEHYCVTTYNTDEGEQGIFLEFHVSADGDIDYTFYNLSKGGSEMDGGRLEVDKDKTWGSIFELAEEIFDFQGIKPTSQMYMRYDDDLEEALENSVAEYTPDNKKEDLEESHKTLGKYLTEAEGRGYKYNTIYEVTLVDPQDKSKVTGYLLSYNGCAPELEIDLVSGNFNNYYDVKNKKKVASVNTLQDVEQFIRSKVKDASFKIDGDKFYLDNESEFLNEDLTIDSKENITEAEEKEYKFEYWVDEEARDEGYGEYDYITASSIEDAIAQIRKYYNRENWASIELLDDKGNAIFGIYPEEDGGEVNYMKEGARDFYKLDPKDYDENPKLVEDLNNHNKKVVDKHRGGKKVSAYLDYELEDDNTLGGGVSFAGETVKDFIADTDIKPTDSIYKLNKELKNCGIKPIDDGINVDEEIEVRVYDTEDDSLNNNYYVGEPVHKDDLVDEYWFGLVDQYENPYYIELVGKESGKEYGYTYGVDEDGEFKEAEIPHLSDDDISYIAISSNTIDDSVAYAIDQALDELNGLGYQGIRAGGNYPKVVIELKNGEIKLGDRKEEDEVNGSFSDVEKERIDKFLEKFRANLGNNRRYDFQNYKWFDEAESVIPRNAKKLTIGDDEYFKDGSNWRKTSEKDNYFPTYYPAKVLKQMSRMDNKPISITEIDKDYKPKKTIEYKVLQGDYGTGWEDLISYETSDKSQLADLKQNIKDYNENEPQYAHRVITRRVPVEDKEELTESVNPRPEYIDYLKKTLGDTYSEQSVDDALIIKGTDKSGQSVGAVWAGKAQKPQIYAIYANDEQRDAAVDKFFNSRKERADAMAERRQARRLTKDHDIKVGDIFYTSWGYDQTNIDFYKVVDVRGSRIDLQPLNEKYVSRGEGGYDDEVMPDDTPASDKLHTVSARADGTLTGLSSFEYLTKWDGKPKSQTNPYSGH